MTGAIIEDIQKAGYVITAAQQFYVNSINSEEFLEIYKGVLPEYTVCFYLFYILFLQIIISEAGNIFTNTLLQAMVTELQSGPCIVMEVSRKDESPNIVADFRNLCGPMDPVSINHFNYLASRY